MAAEYEFFRTPQPKGSNKERYHARMVVKQKVDTKQLARTIARRGAIKEAEVIAVITDLAKVLQEELSEGKSVHIDGIGSFRVSAQSPSVRTRDEVRAESIKFKSVVYTPEKGLRKQLNGMKFVRTTTPHLSADISDIEIDSRLTEHFKDHSYITTKQLRTLCLLTYATALRRLKARVENGSLTHPEHLHSPFYFPVPGHYGVSRDL